jgi:hypothetical protein
LVGTRLRTDLIGILALAHLIVQLARLRFPPA